MAVRPSTGLAGDVTTEQGQAQGHGDTTGSAYGDKWDWVQAGPGCGMVTRQWQSFLAPLLPCNGAGRQHWQCRGERGRHSRSERLSGCSSRLLMLTPPKRHLTVTHFSQNWHELRADGQRLKSRWREGNLDKIWGPLSVLSGKHVMDNCLKGRPTYSQAWLKSWNKKDAREGQSTATTHRQIMTHSNHWWYLKTARAPEEICTHTASNLLAYPGVDRYAHFGSSWRCPAPPLQASKARPCTGLQLCAGDTGVPKVRSGKDNLLFQPSPGKDWELYQSLKHPVLTSWSSRGGFLVVSFTFWSWSKTPCAGRHLAGVISVHCLLHGSKISSQHRARTRLVLLGHSTTRSWMAWQASSHHLYHTPILAFSLSLPSPHCPTAAQGRSAGSSTVAWLMSVPSFCDSMVLSHEAAVAHKASLLQVGMASCVMTVGAARQREQDGKWWKWKWVCCLYVGFCTPLLGSQYHC